MALQQGVKCKNEILHLDFLRLSSILISIAERTNKFKECFKYELKQEPTSLVRDGFMCESRKSDLKNIPKKVNLVWQYRVYQQKILLNK